jgi:hypothetical protein
MIVISTRRAGVFDEDGVYHEGWEQVVTLTDGEANDLLSRYDPASGTSPGVTDARTMARPILNAILEQP